MRYLDGIPMISGIDRYIFSISRQEKKLRTKIKGKEQRNRETGLKSGEKGRKKGLMGKKRGRCIKEYQRYNSF